MLKFKSAALAGALFSSLALNIGTAKAADLTPIAPIAAPSGWIATIGLGPQVMPSFPGSKKYTVWPTGHVDWRRPGEPEPFYSPDDGFDITLLNLGWIKAGPDLRVTPRRGLSGGNGNFFGLHNVNVSIEPGVFLEVWPWQDHLRARFEARQAVTGHKGFVGNVEIDAIQRIGAWTFAIGPRLLLGTTRYMSAYYSVTPAEAALNGIVTPYGATGGVASFGGFASIRYDITPSWSLTGFAGYDRLTNSAAQSPIPNLLGSKNQWTGGGILAYTFNLGALGF